MDVEIVKTELRPMPINTQLNKALRIQHPILLAAMDLVADAKLTLAVSEAGGFGILGAGYGNADWLERDGQDVNLS